MKSQSPDSLKEKKRWRSGLLTMLTIGLLFVAGSHSAWGQVSASISGRIEDSSGAAIPAATVTITSLETGAARTVATDEAGNYRVLSLPVGHYEVRVEKAGFKAFVQTGINLVVGQEAVVSLRLELGEVQQAVTVTGEPALVNTTTASISGLVGEQQVKDLPLNGRSFDLLIALNPGSINTTSERSSGTASGTGIGNAFSVEGRRPWENLFLLNGVEYTGVSGGEVTPGGVSGELLGIDAVREFNVVSGAYSAEYGKRAGAQVSIVTQSGTNSLHGSAFEFLRNSVLDARNYFDHPAGERIPPFKRNQFGGSVGGPLKKDKSFIFGNYEGLRLRLGISDVTFVPDANARQGSLPNAQGVETPVTNLNRGMLPYFAYWPAQNGPTLGGGIAETFSNPLQSIRDDFGTVRFDQNISNKDSLSAAYTVDDSYNLTPLADSLFETTNTLRMQVLSLQETHVFSPQMINTFTAGYSRAGSSFSSGAIGAFPASLSFVVGSVPGSISIGGGILGTLAGSAAITSGGASSSPIQHYDRNLFTYSDGIQLLKGKHQISAGAWFQRVQSNEQNTARVAGAASFSSLTSFLQGTVASYTLAPISTPLAWRSLESAWYLQDVVQLRPSLTLRLGLRQEFTNGWNENNGRAANYVYQNEVVNGVSQQVLVTNTVVGHSALTKNNAIGLLEPRIGLAWDPSGKGKTSIRAGFGTYHDLFDSSDYTLDQLEPFDGATTFVGVPFLSLVPSLPGAPVPPTCGPGVPQPCTLWFPKGIQNNFKTPTVQSWDLAVEQQLTLNMAFRVAYAGSFAVHQWANVDPNQIQSLICSDPAGCISGGNGSARGTVPQGAEYLPVGTLPNPYLASGQLEFSEGNASYNALMVELKRRLSQGLEFRANYTWSKALDDSGAVAGNTVSNQPFDVEDSYNLRKDWGPSVFNATHQATGSFSYQLPIGRGKPWLNRVSGPADKLVEGWQLNSIVTLLSGFPLTVLDGSNRSGSGDSSNPDRPSLNPAFTGPRIVGLQTEWYNPNAFVLQTPGTYGNVGKGSITGPGLATVDFSVFKSTQVSERVGLQFRAEFFNILNRANFGTPNATVFAGGVISPTAGVISTTATNSRQIQFGLKLLF